MATIDDFKIKKEELINTTIQLSNEFSQLIEKLENFPSHDLDLTATEMEFDELENEITKVTKEIQYFEQLKKLLTIQKDLNALKKFEVDNLMTYLDQFHQHLIKEEVKRRKKDLKQTLIDTLKKEDTVYPPNKLENILLWKQLIQFQLEYDKLQPTLWAMDAYLEHLKQRFYFHFQMKRDTNQLNRPEWFFSFLLKSIHQHQPFLQLLQPSFSSTYKYKMMDEFIISLLDRILLPKVKFNLEKIYHQKVPEWFLHTIQEANHFDNQLMELFHFDIHYYSDRFSFIELNRGGPLHLFIRHSLMTKWLHMEELMFSEQFSKMENKWDRSYPDLTAQQDPFKPSVGVIFLLDFLNAQKERFDIGLLEENPDILLLSQKLIQIFFEAIQNDFEIWLKTPKKDYYLPCRFLCSCSYLETVLKRWADLPFYLSACQENDLPFESVFKKLKKLENIFIETLKQETMKKLDPSLNHLLRESQLISLSDLDKEPLESLLSFKVQLNDLLQYFETELPLGLSLSTLGDEESVSKEFLRLRKLIKESIEEKIPSHLFKQFHFE